MLWLISVLPVLLFFIFTDYGVWTMQNSIDGGPFGPISWASILVFGTIQMDYLEKYKGMKFIQKSMILGVPLLVAGLSILTYTAFYLIGDIWKQNIPFLKVLGYNTLIIYILQQILIVFYDDFLPGTAPLWQALLGFVVIYGICHLVARNMAKNKLIVKL